VELPPLPSLGAGKSAKFFTRQTGKCGGNVKVGQECELWLCGLLKTHSCTTRQNGNMAKGQGAWSHLQVYDVVNQLGGGR